MGMHMAVEAAGESQTGGMGIYSWRGTPEHSDACGSQHEGSNLASCIG